MWFVRFPSASLTWTTSRHANRWSASTDINLSLNSQLPLTEIYKNLQAVEFEWFPIVRLNRPSQRHFSRHFLTCHLGKLFGRKYLYPLSPVSSRYPLNTVEVRRNLIFFALWMSAFSVWSQSTHLNSSWVWRFRSSMQPHSPHILDVYSGCTSETNSP